MLVSLNELKADTSKALEARCSGNSSCALVAEQIVHLEAIGLSSLEQLLVVLRQPALMAPWRERAGELSFERRPDILQSWALACYLSDLIASGLNSVKLSANVGAVARWLLPALADSWQTQTGCLALSWQQSGYNYQAHLTAQQRYFAIAYQASSEHSHTPCLQISPPEHIWQQQLPESAWVVYTAKDCQRNYQRSLDRGLVVSAEHWRQLKQLARGVLVPDSELSQAGAGEAGDFVDPEDAV